jgi:hypothetical protein
MWVALNGRGGLNLKLDLFFRRKALMTKHTVPRGKESGRETMRKKYKEMQKGRR